METHKLLIISPTYNERANIRQHVSGLVSEFPFADILIVDDSSSDGTVDELKHLSAANPQVSLLLREGRRHLGRAYVAGMRWGLARDYTTFLCMDSDLSHQPRDAAALLHAVDNGSDIAVGSRLIPSGKAVGWPIERHLLSRLGSLYARTILDLDVLDATSGMKAFRRGSLEAIRPESFQSNGYALQFEILHHAKMMGLIATEVPITFVNRKSGASKMSAAIVREALISVPLMRLTRRKLAQQLHPALPQDSTRGVLVPCYQEEKTLFETVENLLLLDPPVSEVVVVDDGSTDCSVNKLPNDPRLRLIRHSKNLGKGAAIRTGLAAMTSTLVALHDADSEYSPRDLPRLFDLACEAGVSGVLGTRTRVGGWQAASWGHKAANRVFSGIFSLLHLSWVPDVSAGTKVFRRCLINPVLLMQEGWGIDVEIAASVVRQGKAVHAPLEYRARTKDQGKKIRPIDSFAILRSIWATR